MQQGNRQSRRQRWFPILALSVLFSGMAIAGSFLQVDELPPEVRIRKDQPANDVGASEPPEIQPPPGP